MCTTITTCTWSNSTASFLPLLINSCVPFSHLPSFSSLSLPTYFPPWLPPLFLHPFIVLLPPWSIVQHIYQEQNSHAPKQCKLQVCPSTCTFFIAAYSSVMVESDQWQLLCTINSTLNLQLNLICKPWSHKLMSHIGLIWTLWTVILLIAILHLHQLSMDLFPDI